MRKDPEPAHIIDSVYVQFWISGGTAYVLSYVFWPHISGHMGKNSGTDDWMRQQGGGPGWQRIYLYLCIYHMRSSRRGWFWFTHLRDLLPSPSLRLFRSPRLKSHKTSYAIWPGAITMSQTSPDTASVVYISELDLQDLLQNPEPSEPSNEQSPQQLLRWCIAFAKGEARSESTSKISCTSKPNDHIQPGILTSLSIAPELPPPIRNPIQTPRVHTQSPNAANSTRRHTHAHTQTYTYTPTRTHTHPNATLIHTHHAHSVAKRCGF